MDKQTTIKFVALPKAQTNYLLCLMICPIILCNSYSVIHSKGSTVYTLESQFFKPSIVRKSPDSLNQMSLPLDLLRLDTVILPPFCTTCKKLVAKIYIQFLEL